MVNNTALVIGNGGLGDMIVCIGIVNYLATKYKHVLVACMNNNYNQAKTFYKAKNIILYPVDGFKIKINMKYFDILMRQHNIYDIYAYGHYGNYYTDYGKYFKQKYDDNGVLITKKIIYDYPISYYDDIKMPIEYMTKYFTIEYPSEIQELYNELLTNYPNYTVVHQIGSKQTFDIIKHNSLDINKTLTIDVNNNLYDVGHKFYDIANKFINLPSILYYGKLLENADALYLIDSCIHALCLIIDVSKANPKICYQREYRTKYGFDKFKYYLLVDNIPMDIKLPLEPNAKITIKKNKI